MAQKHLLNIYLDQRQVESTPKGFDQLKLGVSLDEENRTFLKELRGSLTFWGDGYKYIRDKYRETNYNGTIEVEIKKKQGEFKAGFTIYRGTIFLSDCKFNLTKRTVDVVVEDIGYTSYIKNNFSLKTTATSTTTKNEEDITAATEYRIELQPDGASFRSYCYEFKELCEYMVNFVSDNKLSFQSDWYDNLPVTEKYMVTTSAAIRSDTNWTNDKGQPLVSLKQLLGGMAKLYNLYVYIDDCDGDPCVRLEAQKTVVDNNDVIININDFEEIEEEFIVSKLYNRVKVGSHLDEIGDNDGNYFKQLSHKITELYIRGQSNIDNLLDITTSEEGVCYGYDQIYQSILGNEDGFDQAVFFIQYNSGQTFTELGLTGYDAEVEANIINSTESVHNPALFSTEVVKRHVYQNSVILPSYNDSSKSLFVGLGSDETSGNDVTEFTATTPSVFTDESNNGFFDNGNNYDNSTGRYTAPADDTYNIVVTVKVAIGAYNNLDNDFYAIPQAGATFDIVRYNNGGVEMSRDTLGVGMNRGQVLLAGGTINTLNQIPFNLYMDSSDYFQIENMKIFTQQYTDYFLDFGGDDRDGKDAWRVKPLEVSYIKLLRETTLFIPAGDDFEPPENFESKVVSSYNQFTVDNIFMPNESINKIIKNPLFAFRIDSDEVKGRVTPKEISITLADNKAKIVTLGNEKEIFVQ